MICSRNRSRRQRPTADTIQIAQGHATPVVDLFVHIKTEVTSTRLATDGVKLDANATLNSWQLSMNQEPSTTQALISA